MRESGAREADSDVGIVCHSTHITPALLIFPLHPALVDLQLPLAVRFKERDPCTCPPCPSVFLICPHAGFYKARNEAAIRLTLDTTPLEMDNFFTSKALRIGPTC